MSPFFARALLILAAAGTVSGCEAASSSDESPAAAAGPAETATESILKSSSPANGATLAGAPDNLVLTFTRPTRLIEVVVIGSDGSEMPIMVTAAGELERFSVPLSGLEPGVYSVRWRATSAGRPYEGSLRFTIR